MDYKIVKNSVSVERFMPAATFLQKRVNSVKRYAKTAI